MKNVVSSERGTILFLSTIVLVLFFLYGYPTSKTFLYLSEEQIDAYLKPTRAEDITFSNGGAITFHEEYADNQKALLAFKHRYGTVYRNFSRLAGIQIDAPIFNNIEDYWQIEEKYALAFWETDWKKFLTEEERKIAASFSKIYFQKYHNEEIRNCKSLRTLQGMVRDESRAKLILHLEFEAYLKNRE